MGRRELLPIRGSGGGGSSGGGSFSESPDSLLTTQFAEIADLIGEGPIEGWASGDALLDTYLDGTPIKNADGTLNFSDVQVMPMWGTLDQEPPTGFMPPAAEQSVGIEVRADRPVVREIVDSRITGVRLTVAVGQLSEQDGNELHGTVVQFAIDMSTNGGAWRQLALDAFNGKTTSGYARSYRIPTSGTGPWRFRVRRVTPDSTSSLVSDKIYWSTISTLVERRFNYPMSAVVFSRVKAKEFSNIPSRQFLLKLQRVQVPQNYDPATRTYATTGPGTTAGGLWDGSFKTAWTDNPAWVWYDLATAERYGLGAYISTSSIDRFELYQIAQYCDELVPDGFGGTEPRFAFNGHFRERNDAIKTLVQLAGAFRSMSYFASNSIFLSQDVPRSAVRTFTAANVENGEFQYVGTAKGARHTVALVKWKDPTNQYRDEVEYVSLADGIRRFGVQDIEVEAVGCVSRGQAHRLGMHTLLSEWFCAETVTFKAGLDAMGVRVGDVIATEDPGRSGDRRGGRLQGATTGALTLDAPVTLRAGRIYEVTCTLPDGNVETRGVLFAGGTDIETSTLDLVAPLSQVPLRMSVWILASDDVPNELWRVLSVAEDGGKAVFTALAYNPDIYAAVDNDTVLAPRPVNTERTRPGAVTELQGHTSLILYNGVTYGVRVSVSWKGGRNTSRFAYRYRVEGGNWEAGSTSMPSLDIDNVPNGTLEFEVTPLNVLGLAGVTATLEYEVVNDSDIGAVTGLRVVGGGTEFSTGDAQFEWDAFDGADYYEVRILEAAANSVIWSGEVTDPAFTWSLQLNTSTGGPRRSFRIGVRAVRPDGRSQAETVITANNPAPPAPALHVEEGFQSVAVSVEQPYPADVRGLSVWISESPIPEAPDDAPLYSGVGLHYSRFNLSAGNQHYLRARLSDDLGVGAISSQVVFVPMFPGGVPVVEDATTITAEPGSEPPSGESYWAVLSQHDGKMYRWDKTTGRYTSAVTAEDIEGKLSEASMPASVMQDLDDLDSGLQQQGQQLADDIRQARQDAGEMVYQEQQARESATEALAQNATALAASLDSLTDDVHGNADAIDALQSTVTTQGDQVTAQSTQLTQLSAKLGSGDLSNTIADPSFGTGDLSVDWGGYRFGMARWARGDAPVPVNAVAGYVAQVWQRDTMGGRIVPCKPGDRFWVSARVATPVEGAPSAGVGVCFYGPGGWVTNWIHAAAVASANAREWVTLSGVVTAPAGVVAAQFWIQIAGPAAELTPLNATWFFELPEMHAISGPSALVDVERQARVTETEALSQQIGSVSATLEGVGSALVQVQQQAQVTADKLIASWGMKVNVNGIVSGVVNYSDGSTSTFKVMADSMYVVPTNAVVDPDFEAVGTYWNPSEPGAWFVEGKQSNGINGALRQWALWDGTYNGTARRHVTTPMMRCPFSAGEQVRFRMSAQLFGGTQTLRTAVWFYETADANGTVVLEMNLDWVQGEHQSKQLIETLPNTAKYYRVVAFNNPDGQPFAGSMRFSLPSLVRATGTDMIVDGSITASALAASVINTVALQAHQVIADQVAVNGLSALSANLGDVTAGRITFGGDDWGYIRTLDKWWDENQGFIIAHNPTDNHFFYQFNGYRPGAKSWFEQRANYDPEADQCLFRLQVIKDGVKRLVFDTDTGEFFLNGHIEAVSGFFSDELRGAHGTFGTITAGLLQNQGGRNAINLNASGSDALLIGRDGAWNEKVRINADGTYKFAQVVATGSTGVSGYGETWTSNTGPGTLLSVMIDTGYYAESDQLFGLVVTGINGSVRVGDGVGYGFAVCHLEVIVQPGSTSGLVRSTGGGSNAVVGFYVEGIGGSYKFFVDVLARDNVADRAYAIWINSINWQLVRIT